MTDEVDRDLTDEPRAATKGDRTREAILERALDHSCMVGLAGLTIGSLASDTGMSKSGLYAHFGSKESLQIAVLDAAADEFARTVVTPALAAPRGEQRILALVDLWLDCGRTRQAGGCVIVKASTELDAQPGPLRDRLRAHHRRLDDAIARILAGGISEGQFRHDVDMHQFATDLYGVMLAFYHGYRLLADPEAETRARTAVAALLDAARPRGARPADSRPRTERPTP